MAFVGIYRALYDYHPQSPEELAIHDNDLLFILDKSSDDGWWKCRKKAASDDDDEPEGLIPNNYVGEVEPTHKAKALYDYTKQTDEELSFQEGEELSVYDETDPDWTLVGCKGEYGFAPAIYIEPLSAAGGGSAQVREAPPAMPPRPAAAADDDGPIPGEDDYVPPSSPGQAATGPAAQLANILAQKTGSAGAEPPALSAPRTLASPPPPSARVQYTPDASSAEEEEEEAPPPKPARPASQSLPSPQQVQSPKRSESQFTPSGTAEAPPILPSSPIPDSPRSPGGYHLYNIHETVSHMGKSRKLPMTLGINVMRGTIMISPEKSRDGAQQEWTAEKMQHYSIEGKHVFLELVRPSKSVDFHAGAKDTAQEIVAHLGELAGAARMEGLREVWDAANGGSGGRKTGKMLYEFLAQGEDEVTVAAGDEVVVLDDAKSEEWWMVRRLKNGKEGVVPSSYVEITGTVPKPQSESMSGLNAGRSTVEQNRLEEERLAKAAATSNGNASQRGIPERQSSLDPSTVSAASASSSRRNGTKRASGSGKSKPNTARVRTWTDRSGTFKVDAEFIGLREGKIHLHKLNGVKIAVPVAKMAVEDLEYVERATGASLDEDKPLSEIKRKSTQRQVAKAGGAGASVVPKDQDYWFEFFLGCGVNPQICDRYASAFSRDQMGPEVLPEVNEALLRTLGLKEGDILRVMKVLDNKFDRKSKGLAGAPGGPGGEDPDRIEQAGGLFSGPGGALKDNTRKGRPAPAVQTNDVVSADAFKSDNGTESVAKSPTEGAQRTVLASAPAREPKTGFEDDAWDVKPARRTVTAESAQQPPRKPEPLINEDIESLSITSPPLQPTPAPAPVTAPSQSPNPPSAEQQKQGADQAIFDKIASLAPARQRPQPPPTQQSSGGGLAPPPRASSAPGFNPQQNSFGNVAPLQAQLTGYQPQQQQQYQQAQQTGFGPPQGYPQGQQPNGFMPQPTGIQAVQQNYPALQPQPTGMNFQPQSHFGQVQQQQQYGVPPQQTGFQGQQTGFQPQQQQFINGAQPSNSPFADPPRQPYQPGVSSGLQNSFSAQQTGFQPQPQQPQFSMSQPTGLNGYGPPPQLPPQQTGGVFGPPQPTGSQAPPAPLVPQKTGPAPPVRFGVKPGEKKLVPQPTGRANLAKATPQNPFGF